MSYRTLKRMLGETSLERKCRFLFGGGLMLLISGSFYFYAQLNARILEQQNQETAQLLVAPIIMEKHMKSAQVDEAIIEEMAATLKPEQLQDYRWRLMKADPSKADSVYLPADEWGYEALSEIRGGKSEFIVQLPEKDEYRYYAAVHASQSCVSCHYHQNLGAQEGDLIGMAKITIPLTKTNGRLAKNYAILLAMAIMTSFLAMLAAYAIVRYVIVKPVLHLKDVSDEIARGNLDLRADISTGDEFEELSHAFNRMLRHLVTVQDELKNANNNLDSKVDELAQANMSLFEMNKLKNEFLATMSHELRTPLNSILGFSDVLSAASNLNDKQKKYLSNISSSGKNLLSLINDILDLAKIESGKMELHVVEFSLEGLVDQICTSMHLMAESKNIELTWDITDQKLKTIQQDSGKIQQILTNLLSNAIKFTPDGGRVQLTIRPEVDNLIRISVADTGIGIPLADQERIFEKFRQGRSIPGQEDTLTREYEGTGLGLSIVKELCKLLGGEIRVESEFGKGSTFDVLLPSHLEAQESNFQSDSLQYQTIERTREKVRNLIQNEKQDLDSDSGTLRKQNSARDAG